jgi:endonuclease G
MRKLIFLALIAFSFGANAQGKISKDDTVRLVHSNYISVFSKSLKYPVVVEWWATKAKVTCAQPIPRKDDFKPDPLLPEFTDLAKDYVGSGTDRGHMAPAADNQCSGLKAMTESFYFSNMAAQYGALNRGDWKSLEMQTRKIAAEQDSVHIWAGNIGEAKRIGRVAVPQKCWKVIHIKKTNEWLAYLFENNLSKADGINNNKVEVKDIEKLTGLKFKK